MKNKIIVYFMFTNIMFELTVNSPVILDKITARVKESIQIKII